MPEPTASPVESFAGEHRLRDGIANLSNWGRWGADDELGALNLVGPAEIMRATSLVQSGNVVSLGLPLDQDGPQLNTRRGNPRLLMTATGTDHLAGGQTSSAGRPIPPQFGVGDDTLVGANQAGTHIDALSHIFWEGQMYNGHSAASVTSGGAAHCDVATMQGRGVVPAVLADVARHLEQKALPPGFGISPELLSDTLAAQSSTVRPGDALIVRTGFLGARRQAWGDYCGGDAPGLSLDTANWLHERDVSLVASDTWGVEVRPNEIDMFQPLHVVALVYGGRPFGENFVLDPLGEACARLGRWEFMLCVAPLAITGACGSPVDPLALL